jgi:serine/threonine-protein kinase
MSAPARQPGPLPGPGSFAALTVLGLLSCLLAVLLWAELVSSRALGTPGCLIGEGASCAALWDAPFASAVHDWSGLPIAAWGLVWGLVACLLPLELLRRKAEQQDVTEWLSAVRLVAGAGLVAACVLVAVALMARSFCTGCFAMYVLVGGYAGIALFGWQAQGLPRIARAAGIAAGGAFTAFLLLLYPGWHTPRSGSELGRAALAHATADGIPELDALISSLDARSRQMLSDSLGIYRRSARGPLPTPRRLRGAAAAPVQITDFTDALCPGCADLHLTLEQLFEIAPPGSFAVDSRQFPLDASCNPLVERSGEPVRCDAARARLCLAGDDRALGFDAALFAAQDSLTPERVREIAGSFVPLAELDACLADASIQRQIEVDAELASGFGLESTPLVIVNGKHGTSFGPFLYALILTGGNPDHPAFSALPPPRADAHLH